MVHICFLLYLDHQRFTLGMLSPQVLMVFWKTTEPLDDGAPLAGVAQ